MKTGELLSYRATPENQPELWRFVQRTADRLGVAVPTRLELYPVPEVELAGGRLLLGLPLVAGLDADELAEVIGHELVCERTRQDWVVPRGGSSGPAGPDQVASALLHSAHLAVGFERFVLQHVGPLAAAGYYPADLWEGWRAEVTARGAGGRGGALPVPLRPLGIEVEAGFARLIAEEFGAVRGGSDLRLRPVTFDEVPPEVWDAALGRGASAIRAAAALVLRRPRATSRDVLDLALRDGQAAEVLRLAGFESPELDPVARTLTPLIHEVLRRRMYRFEHPLRQQVYVGPAWDRVDVAELLASLDQPNTQAHLAYLLG